MPENEQQFPPEPKPEPSASQDDNLVKSIFDKDVKRPKTSSLFRQGEKTEADGSTVKVTEEQKEIKPVHPRTFSLKIGRPKKVLPLGIDLGFSSIKLVQLALVDNRPKIIKLVLKELPLDLVEAPEKRNERLPGILTDLLRQHNISGEAFSAVPTSSVNIRNLSFPKMPPNEIASSVTWEIRRIVGENMDDVTYDHIILNENKPNQFDKADVLAIMSSKKDILDYLNLLESTGLKVQAIEAESFPLAASLDYNHNISPNEVVMLLDFGANSTKLNMIRNNELQFTRVLNINGNALTTAIKDYCQVSFKEAENIKREYKAGDAKSLSTSPAVPPPENSLNRDFAAYNAEYRSEPTQIKNAITLLLEKLVSDIDHTFKYYSYQLTKSEVQQYSKIIVSGGMANFQMLVPFLKSRLNVPVEIDNPLGAFDIASETISGVDDLQKNAVRFGVAVGLALRSIE